MRPALVGIERALFWTLAIAAFAAVAAGFGWRAVDRLATSYESQRANYAIVRVIAPEGPEGMATAETALADAPHVSSAAPMTAGRAAALLRDWGGAPVAAADMPPLRLIEVELAVSDTQMDVDGDILAALSQAGVTAEFLQAPADAGQGGISQRARVLSLWLAAAFAAVMTLIIGFAARGLAVRRREMVVAMADLGATKGQATGKVGNEAALAGWWAGVAGGVTAGLVGAMLVLVLVPETTPKGLLGLLEPIDFAPMLAAPFICAIAASMGARAAAESFYAQATRLA